MSRVPLSSFPGVPRLVLIGLGALLIVSGVAALVWVLISPASPPIDVVDGASSSTASSSPSASGEADAGSAAPASASPTAGDGVPSAAEPRPSLTAAPPPANGDAPVITSFSVSPTAPACRDDRSGTVPLTFAWNAEGADRAWIGVGTTDASAQPFAQVAPTQPAYGDLAFSCNTEQKVFTLTVEGDGGRTSRSVLVTRVLP